MQVVKEPSSSSSSGINNNNNSSTESKKMESPAMTTTMATRSSSYEKLRIMASGNAVVIFSMTGCCMCHVVKQLLFGLGVGPTVVELDRDITTNTGREIQSLLFQLADNNNQQQQQLLPAVFIGGKFLGGIETVMACHINGTLVPLLKDAGALWL